MCDESQTWSGIDCAKRKTFAGSKRRLIDTSRRRQWKLVLLRIDLNDRRSKQKANRRESNEMAHRIPPFRLLFESRRQRYRVTSPLNTNFWIRLPSCTSVT